MNILSFKMLNMRYLALVKNMRCILDVREENDDTLKIIRKYHRNRGVGIMTGKGIPKGKCFVEINPPEDFADIYAKVDFEGKFLILSSSYLAPIVTDSLENYRKYCVREIRHSDALDISNFLRHLRIAEYSLIDYYAEIPKNFQDFLDKDVKRFWRLKHDEGKRTVGMYLHLKEGTYELLSIALEIPR